MAVRLCLIILAGCTMWSAAAGVCDGETDRSDPEAAASMLDLLRVFIGYPYESTRDMDAVERMLLRLDEACRAQSGDNRIGKLLDEMHAFISTKTNPYEHLSVVSFAGSNDVAIVKLRDGIGIPPPAGGAILRVYSRRDAMPSSILRNFSTSTLGVTRWRCCIAVCSEGLSSSEVREVVSHELAHAYVNSCADSSLGDLPEWFCEGLALYASDRNTGLLRVLFGENGYDSDSDMIQVLFDLRSAEHGKELVGDGLAIRYLRRMLGQPGFALFVRQAVEQGSVEGPMITVFGTDSPQPLMNHAYTWQTTMRWIGWGGVAGLAVFAFLLFRYSGPLWRAYLKSNREMAEFCEEEKVEESIARVRDELDRFHKRERTAPEWNDQALLEDRLETLALSLIKHGRALEGIGMRAEAAQRLDAAMHLAPWSSLVAQELRDPRRKEWWAV